MKVRITTHPIDFEILDKLRINATSLVPNNRVGSVLTRLAKNGYKNMHIYYDEDQYGREELRIHCKQSME